MTMTLAERVRTVALARATVAKRGAILTERRRAWEAANAEEIDGLKRDQDYLAEAEAALRAAATAAYEQTGIKTPTPGVGIRVISKLRYDPATALRWAEDHKLALSLDKAAFERQAKITPLSFVEVIETPQATIATDLSEVVAEVVR